MWEGFRRAWREEIAPEDVRKTAGPGHAREITLATEGYDVVAAAGGDGTAGEVLSGVMALPPPRPVVATIPCGTGNDIARTIGIPDIETAAAALRVGQARWFDILRAECSIDGRPETRHAFLFCSAGLGADLLSQVKPWMKRFLPPRGAYFLGAFLSVLSYRPRATNVRWEGGGHDGRVSTICVANAEWAGGGSMRVGPGARADDGEADITIVPARSRADLLCWLRKISSGAHVRDPGISYFRAGRVTVESDPPTPIQMDGDIFGTTPASFEIRPHAVQFVTPARLTPAQTCERFGA